MSNLKINKESLGNLREIAIMQDKVITLIVFFTTLFVFIQIKFIFRLRKLRKNSPDLPGILFLSEIEAGFAICFQCCAYLTGTEEKRNVRQEEKAIRQSDEFERRTAEKRKKEKKEYIALIELEKIDRPERVKVLRASGYTASERDRNKVIDIVNINPKTGLPWTSTTARIPVEEVVLIIESEPDFEIKDEYIINKKKLLLEKEKKKAAENICPICNNTFESGSDFCPNCGYDLK